MRGLLSHIKRAATECCELVDLVKICKNKPVEIIVDFKAVRSELFQDLSQFLVREYGNSYLSLPGGEYEITLLFLKNYFQQLLDIGLKLTFVMDFLYPSDDENPHEIKHHQWIKRRVDLLETNKQLALQMNYGSEGFFENSSIQIPLPLFFYYVMENLAKDMGFELIYPFGNETDFDRAKLVRDRGAFAVLTNDTEYVLFQDIPVIVWQLFDVNKDIRFKLENGSSTLQSLTCLLTKSSLLQKNLKLLTHNQLIDLTSLAGNLFTLPHVQSNELTGALRLSTNLYKIAEFVRRFSGSGHLEDSSILSGVISRHSKRQQIREGFSNARKYFSLQQDPSHQPFQTIQNPIIKFLITPESVKEYTSNAYETAMGSSWLGMPMQDLNIPCVSEKLLPIHQRLAGFLHKAQKNSIIHMYLRPDLTTHELSSIRVSPISSGDGSTIEEIIEKDVDKNIKRFVEIVTYYRIENGLESCDEEMEELLNSDNFEKAFSIYTFRLLRYINPSNYFTEDEIMTLAISIVALQNDKYHQQIQVPLIEKIYRMKLRVTMKHLTLFNWYQEIMWVTTYLCSFLRLQKFINMKKLIASMSMQLFVAFLYITQEKRGREPSAEYGNVESCLSQLFKTIKQENESYFKLIMKS